MNDKHLNIVCYFIVVLNVVVVVIVNTTAVTASDVCTNLQIKIILLNMS